MNKKHKVPGTDQWITEEQAIRFLASRRVEFPLTGIPRFKTTFNNNYPNVISVDHYFNNNKEEQLYFDFRIALRRINEAILELNGRWRMKNSGELYWIPCYDSKKKDWVNGCINEHVYFSIFEPCKSEADTTAIIASFQKELKIIEQYKFNK